MNQVGGKHHRLTAGLVAGLDTRIDVTVVLVEKGQTPCNRWRRQHGYDQQAAGFIMKITSHGQTHGFVIRDRGRLLKQRTDPLYRQGRVVFFIVGVIEAAGAEHRGRIDAPIHEVVPHIGGESWRQAGCIPSGCRHCSLSLLW